MVRFSFPEERLQKKTTSSQLFLCGEADNSEKVWVPLNKFNQREDLSHPGCREIVMPKWLFLKTSLPYYIKYEEFVAVSDFEDFE